MDDSLSDKMARAIFRRCFAVFGVGGESDIMYTFTLQRREAAPPFQTHAAGLLDCKVLKVSEAIACPLFKNEIMCRHHFIIAHPNK
jgi:hypothetical protein